MICILQLLKSTGLRGYGLGPPADDEPGEEIGASDVATLAAEGAEAQGEHDRRSSRAADERWGGEEERESGFMAYRSSVHSSPTPPPIHVCTRCTGPFPLTKFSGKVTATTHHITAHRGPIPPLT